MSKMEDQKQNKKSNLLDVNPQDLEDKIDDITNKVQSRINLLFIVPTLVSKLFTGIGSILISFGEVFNIGSSNSNRRS